MYDLIVVSLTGLITWFGFVFGVMPVTVFGLEIFAAFTAGVLLHEAVGGLLAWLLQATLGAFFPDASFQNFAVGLSFFLIVWGTVVLLRFLYHPDDLAITDAVQDAAPLSTIERAAGVAAGAATGFVTAGAFLVTFSILPLPSFLLPTPTRMFFDAGSIMLRAAGRFQPDAEEGHSLVADGEPATRGGGGVGPTTSEPWVDLDKDGVFSESDRWHDSDDNGTFNESIGFIDVDGDGTRRIGLVEKYSTGVWNGTFDRMDTALTLAANEPRAAATPVRGVAPPTAKSRQTIEPPTEVPDDDF
jgi:hypothetical protein